MSNENGVVLNTVHRLFFKMSASGYEESGHRWLCAYTGFQWQQAADFTAGMTCEQWSQSACTNNYKARRSHCCLHVFIQPVVRDGCCCLDSSVCIHLSQYLPLITGNCCVCFYPWSSMDIPLSFIDTGRAITAKRNQWFWLDESGDSCRWNIQPGLKCAFEQGFCFKILCMIVTHISWNPH